MRQPANFIAALLLSSTLACDPAAGPEGPFVEVEPAARQLIEEILTDASAAVWYSARFTDSGDNPHLAFAGWLAGRTDSYFAHISLATTDPGEYQEFCSADAQEPEPAGFWLEHDSCSRLRISDAFYMDVYFTEQPHRLPGDRHEMRYRSDGGPAGTIVYPQNPLITWIYIFHPDGSVGVHAWPDLTLRLEPDAGGAVTLDYTGALKGTLNPNQTVVTTLVELEFPDLTDCPVPLSARVEDDGDLTSGVLRCGDRDIALISHPGDAFVFDWLEG